MAKVKWTGRGTASIVNFDILRSRGRGNSPPCYNNNESGIKMLDDLVNFKDFDFSIYENVLCAIEPIIRGERDHDIAWYGLSAQMPDPLDANEIRLLSVGMLADITSPEKIFSYNDVLKSLDQPDGPQMSLATIYKLLNRLNERGLIDDAGRLEDPDTGRVSQRYKVNDLGRNVFRLAITALGIMKSGTVKDAA